MYQFYQIMICLLKFDFFFFTGVTMQVRRYALLRTRSYLILSTTADHRHPGQIECRVWDNCCR